MALQELLDAAPKGEHYCDSRNYDKWENWVAGLLNCLHGYRDFIWVTTDGDSFGPLVRSATATNRRGEIETASYG